MKASSSQKELLQVRSVRFINFGVYTARKLTKPYLIE